MFIFIALLAVAWLGGVIFSAASHRAVKISLPIWISAIFALATSLLTLLVGWAYIWYMPGTQFAAFACFVLGSWFWISALHRYAYRYASVAFSQFSPSEYWWSLLQGLLLFVFQWILLAGAFFLLLLWDSRCYAQKQNALIFTGHLKSLCVENKGNGLCPKNEDELRAFDPQRYRQLQRCARTRYTYDSVTERFKWSAKFHGQEIIATPEDLPGVGTPPRD